jgi:tripartite-type tricarboxylate transporter receptor subunit TctC
MNSLIKFLTAGTLALTLTTGGAAAEDAAFYKGKVIQIINPFGLAGVYGIYVQLLTAHLGRHIPGEPRIIQQTMPGAGGVKAMQYVTNIAPKDGTVLVMPMATLAQQDLLDPKVTLGGDKFQFIGRMEAVEQVGVVWRKSGVTSIADAAKKQLHAGGVGIASATALNARLLNIMTGTRFRIISSYKDMGDIVGAFERGEVDLLTASWDIISERFPAEIGSGEIVPLYAFSISPIKGLEQTPLITSFARTEQEKAFMQIYTVVTQIGRALAAPPGVPATRVETLRKAFDSMIVDPEFSKTIAKANIRINAMPGQELQEIVAAAYRLPPQQIESARVFYDSLLTGAR